MKDLTLTEASEQICSSETEITSITLYDNKIQLHYRKTGEWTEGGIGFQCSICNYGVFPWNNTPYCPNCGARMKGEEE